MGIRIKGITERELEAARTARAVRTARANARASEVAGTIKDIQASGVTTLLGIAAELNRQFNSQKGYGFIQPQDGGKDVFVHISAVERAGLPGLNEGQSIEYEVISNRGKASAENLKVQR